MVKTELIMRRLTLIAALFLGGFAAMGQEYEWEAAQMDGSRTGTISPSKDNVTEAIGEFKGGKYVAPNGRAYSKRSIVGKTASIVMAAQPEMARVKDVIGYSPRSMTASYPESALSNWFVDILMARTEKLSGKKVDIGVANFGGIRVDMPEGDIILDDMLSMFPFKNQLVYVEHTGKQIRTILEEMAAGRFQVLGGVRVVAEGGKLVEATIGGEPIDDDKVYGMATISFLLYGGDALTLGHNALSVTVFENEDIIDAVLEYVHKETAAGRPIEYEADGRVVVKDFKKKKRR
jgi:2',3'-cyclic-nucleotide 2'-phosphodiesterase (5'-nucleotidase family)